MSDDVERGLIGPGLFVAVVGASGTGKDTLLRSVQDHFGPRGRVQIARRHITRAADASEQHVAISAEEFDVLKRENAFALSWHAHGLDYGIARSIDDDIRGNRVVLCNVSRTIIAGIRQRYANVFAIEVVASRAVRQARLTARGREHEDDVQRRLDRHVDAKLGGLPDMCIENSGGIDRSVAMFVNALSAVASAQLGAPKSRQDRSA